MKNLQSEAQFFEQLLTLLEQQLGVNSEIVLHDYEKGFSSAIADIRNGHITGRVVGDSGTNMGLEVLSGTVKNGDKYNYVTRLKNGRIVRSSSLYIKNDEGNVIGSLCINTDITDLLKLEDVIKQYAGYELATEEENGELFLSDVNQLIDYLLQEGHKLVGKDPEEMSREDKIRFIHYLDEKGAFLITKSGERIQDYLGISKYTLYKYLDMSRNGKT